MSIQDRNTYSSAPIADRTGYAKAIFLIGFVALALGAVLIIPFRPEMPNSGLDPSWRYAINQAVSQGLVFGRDLVFTFGPLGSVYTTLYNPGTDTIMLVGSTLFAVGLCTAMGLATPSKRFPMLMAVPVIFAIDPTRDAVFLVLPFFLLLSIGRTLLPVSSPAHLRPTRLVLAGIAVATIATAITPLVKGSFAGTVGACCGLAFLALARRSLGIAFAWATLIGLTIVSAWVATGQPLAELPKFFISQGPIISGYTNAMSLDGSRRSVAAVLLGSAILTAAFYRYFAKKHAVTGWIILLGLVFTLFVSFKAGFVRADGHVFISTGALLLVAYIVSTLFPLRSALVITVLSMAIWFGVGSTFHSINGSFFVQRAQQAFQALKGGMDARVFTPDTLRQGFDAANARIRSEVPLPRVSGSVDIYPTELSPIFANNLEWVGRPVPQSYSAYEPALDDLNAQHLLKPDAAKNIFFAFATIDGRFPALDDSRSIVELLSRYHVVGLTPRFVQLERHADRPMAAIDEQPFRTLKGQMEQAIDVKEDSPVWVSMDVRPTFAGKILSTLYKLPLLDIELSFDDGRTATHRFIAGIGKTGFIVSPYLTDARDYIELAAGVRSRPQVVSFKIISKRSMFWRSDFPVELRRISVAPQPSAQAVLTGQRAPM